MSNLWSVEQEASGSLQPDGALVGAAETHEPSVEPGGGQDASSVWFGPGGILVSRWAAEVCWMDAPRGASEEKVQVPWDIQAGR